jgi:glycosyltransferase involved in cell wall biosynthesis
VPFPDHIAEEPSLDVSIVLPIYNESGHIAREIERIRGAMDASGLSYEIVCVDDGSTDGSVEELRALEGIERIELPRNRGCGTARRIGTLAARGRLIVWSDADMTYPNDRIPELVREMEDGYDQVVGARRTEEGTHAWARRPAKAFIRRLASYLMQTEIPDLNSGYRVFRREAVRRYLHMLPAGFSCVTTITMAFLSNGHAIKYVPLDYESRAGKSKFHWRQDTFAYVLQVVRMVMTYEPLRVFLPLGGALFVIALFKVGWDAITKHFYVTSNAIVLTFVSLHVIAIGLLADLMVRLESWRDRERG